MVEIGKLIPLIEGLCTSASEVTEESHRLVIRGEQLRPDQAALLVDIGKELAVVVPDEQPVMRVGGESVALNELEGDDSYLNVGWQFILAKARVSSLLRARSDETTVLFFSENRLCRWLEGIDPLTVQDGYAPDFSNPTTIRVVGLAEPFGGPLLWVLPVDMAAPDASQESGLPDSAETHGLVHVVSTGTSLRIAPRGWALTWGGLDSRSAKAFARLGCIVLGACLVHEIKRGDDHSLMVTIRGGRTHKLALWNSNSTLKWCELMKQLVEAVIWLYAERAETRLRLMTERLALDLNDGECWLACLQRHLPAALRQARDSYGFVILERKDAYFKEMRELMKDMKSQADLYAVKVRDLVSSLVRDTLGVLVFIAFSFVGKFDHQRLYQLLDSGELALFLKVLTAYLVVSFIVQIAAHWRDDQLSRSESENWLNVLQNYTGSQDKMDHFLAPLARRRTTLHVAMIISGVFYGVLALLVLNLPLVVKGML
jgi:hypothetical protein